MLGTGILSAALGLLLALPVSMPAHAAISEEPTPAVTIDQAKAYLKSLYLAADDEKRGLAKLLTDKPERRRILVNFFNRLGNNDILLGVVADAAIQGDAFSPGIKNTFSSEEAYIAAVGRLTENVLKHLMRMGYKRAPDRDLIELASSYYRVFKKLHDEGRFGDCRAFASGYPKEENAKVEQEITTEFLRNGSAYEWERHYDNLLRISMYAVGNFSSVAPLTEQQVRDGAAAMATEVSKESRRFPLEQRRQITAAIGAPLTVSEENACIAFVLMAKALVRLQGEEGEWARRMVTNSAF